MAAVAEGVLGGGRGLATVVEPARLAGALRTFHLESTFDVAKQAALRPQVRPCSKPLGPGSLESREMGEGGVRNGWRLPFSLVPDENQPTLRHPTCLVVAISCSLLGRLQAVVRLLSRRTRAMGQNLAWPTFCRGAKPGTETNEAKAQHARLQKVVMDMIGGEVSTEELNGAMSIVIEALSETASRTPVQQRAMLVAELGHVDQELFKEALSLVRALNAWLATLPSQGTGAGGSPPPAGPICSAATPGIWSGLKIEWGSEVARLPLPGINDRPAPSGQKELATYAAGPAAAGARGGGEGGGGGGGGDVMDLVDWLHTSVMMHCGSNTSALGAEDMLHAITESLTSRSGEDEVQAQLFDLLGMEALDLIWELVTKRKKLVAAIKYEQAGVRGPRQPAQTQVGGFTIMTERDRKEMKAQRKLDKKFGKMLFDDAGDSSLGGPGGFDPDALRRERERQLAAGPVTGDRQGPTADGSIAGYGGVNGLMGSGVGGAEMVLPEGAERKVYKKEGYEEITVPAAKKPPVDYKAVPNSAFSALVAPAMQHVPFLNRIQSKVFPVAYKTSNNMLVCAPTGAGKTEVAMMTVLRQIEQCVTDRGTLDVSEMKIVYVAPMKALAAEVTEKFSKRLNCLGVHVKELTGDTQLSRRDITDTQMLVVTPEKWDVMTRKTSDAGVTAHVRLLIIDEIHLLNEERGAVIEAIVARTLRQVESSQTSIRIVGLSATLPTYKDVAVFLRVNVNRDLFYFDSSYRPVPLETCFIGVMGSNINKVKGAMNEITYKKVLDRVRKGYQVMVFVHSRKDTAKTAKTIMETAQQEGTDGVFTAREHPQYDSQERFVQKSKNKEVRELFAGGFGVHHAGMLRGDRSLTERLFSLGLVKVLVCTATLAWGVNLPAHSVLIKGTQIYDAKQGKFVELSILDVMQIFGRAGRPQFDDSGEGMIVTTHDKLAHYMKLMTAALPIESTLQASLTDHLNAEVVLGTVRTLKEAIAWLSYTYLYVRMLKNPTHYGVAFHEIQSDPMLTVRCKELIEGSIKELARAKMLRYNFETHNMNTTETGIVASHYYVKYASLELYNQHVHPAMSEGDVFDVVARSAEFENIQVRDEERQELLHLLADCTQVKIKMQEMEGEGILLDERTKVNILLQAYISRAQVDGFALVADMNHITQSAGRIFRALFELALKKGWVTLSERLLNLCKVRHAPYTQTQCPTPASCIRVGSIAHVLAPPK